MHVINYEIRSQKYNEKEWLFIKMKFKTPLFWELSMLAGWARMCVS